MQSHAIPLVSEHSFQQLETIHDTDAGIFWCLMNPSPRPCFTPTLLDESRSVQRQLVQSAKHPATSTPDYLVLASQSAGVFNLGGDLELFMQLIGEQNRTALANYARACIEVCYHQAINLDLPLTTVALVQGDALGGGFEAALSCRVIIAEKQAQFGLPEVLFNLFPGMGAYSFLSRRLNPSQAERIIMSGKMYTASELYDLGVIDVLAEEGEGIAALHDYIARHKRSRNSQLAMQRVRQQYNPITYEELIAITDIWVDAALKLTPKDLKLMQRLVRAQDKRHLNSLTTDFTATPAVRAIG